MILNLVLRFVCIALYLNEKVTAASFDRSSGTVHTSIVGGIDAKIEEIPWQAQLRIEETLQLICGGSIISQNWIVSAAHCVGKKGLSLVVVVGTDSNSVEHDGTTYRIKQYFIHKSYDPIAINNDISVIQTSTPMSFSNRVRSIPISEAFVESGRSVQVSGWGYVNNNGGLPNTLQKLKTSTISNDKCRSLYPDEKIVGTHLCTFVESRSDPKGFCNGDSGGPLTLDGKLVGIVSWSEGCAEHPDVFERVSSHCEWIKQKSGISCEPLVPLNLPEPDNTSKIAWIVGPATVAATTLAQVGWAIFAFG